VRHLSGDLFGIFQKTKFKTKHLTDAPLKKNFNQMGFIYFLLLIIVVAYAQDKVLLKDVSVITLKAGHLTTGRRNAPIQQLLCQNCDDAASKNVVSIIQCRNAGFDGRDVNWRCETSIDKRYSLQKTEVSCEGYAYPDDPYILVGSCAVEYWLNKPLTPRDQHAIYTVGALFVIAMMCWFIFIICTTCCCCTVASAAIISSNSHTQYSPPIRHRSSRVFVETTQQPYSTVYVNNPPQPTVYVNNPPPVVFCDPPRQVEVRQRPKEREEEEEVSVSYATTKRR
jgi:uncharacterized protein YlaI